jgi:hypothetical protein
VVAGSCRGELAEEAPESPDVPLDESSVVVESEDVQEVRRTSDLDRGRVREKQARGSSEIVAGIEAMAIKS